MKRSSAHAGGTKLIVALDMAIKRFEEHWVYDAAELFADCALAAHRIESVLKQLKRRPNEIRDRDELRVALKEFTSFEKDWEKMAEKHLGSALACPDEVEHHLKRIREAGLSKRKKAKTKSRDADEDFCRSFESVQRIRNPI